MTSRSGKTYYLTSDPQQEVDHSVAVLLVDGFALGPRGGSARDARSARRAVTRAFNLLRRIHGRRPLDALTASRHVDHLR